MPNVDINEVFERFKSGGPLMIPPGPDAARRTSQRRRRVQLTALAAAAAVVAITAPVIAYNNIAFQNGPLEVGSPVTPTVETPNPVWTTSPTPDSDDEPITPVLQPSDVPAGYQYEGDNIDGDWTLEFASQVCAPPNNLAGAPWADTRWGASFRNGSGPTSHAILQRVDQHTVADAQAYVQAVRAMAQGCVQQFGDPMTWAIEHQGFAADDSLVLSWDGDGFGNTYVVVRAGGLVTQLWYRDTDIIDPVQLGQRAADRLCAGPITC
jgi:hypothetical protein